MSEPIALTSENLKALRSANTILFRYHAENSPHAPKGWDLPRTVIECIKREDPDDGFGERERRVLVDVNEARFTNYRDSHSAERVVWDIPYAIWGSLYTWWDEPVGTVIRGFLKVGDRIRPHFICANDNESLRNAGLTHDELRLIVDRGPLDEPSKVKRFTFLLDDVIYPPNATLRNVHMVPKSKAPTYELNIEAQS